MLIVGNKISETKVEIQGVYIDNSITQKIDIEQLPQKPSDMLGKEVILFMNPITQEVYYEYIDRPLTSAEEEIQALTEENSKLKEDMANAISAVDFILTNFQPLI